MTSDQVLLDLFFVGVALLVGEGMPVAPACSVPHSSRFQPFRRSPEVKR